MLKILFATTQTEDTLKSEVFDPFFPVVYQEERQIAVIDDDPAFGEKIRGCFPTCRVDFYRSLEEHIQQLSARKLFMVICDISFIGRQVIERYRLLKNCPDYVVIKRFCTSAHMMPLFSSGLGRPLCFRKGNILMELYRPQTQGVNDG